MNEDEGALTIPPPTRAVAIQEGPGALLTAIVQMARDPSVDADKMEKLLAMQERMVAREAERQFNQAMMRLPPIHVKKNGTIDLTSKEDRAAGRAGKSVPFAKWEDMAAVVEPLLEREGFRLSFDSIPRPGDGGGLIVTGRLSHRDGHGRTASMPLPLDSGPGRNNLQAIGSTLSYGKRYAAEMLLNIVRERSFLILRSSENYIIYGCALAYFFCIQMLTPQYFRAIVPMALATYSEFGDNGGYSNLYFLFIGFISATGKLELLSALAGTRILSPTFNPLVSNGKFAFCKSATVILYCFAIEKKEKRKDSF